MKELMRQPLTSAQLEALETVLLGGQPSDRVAPGLYADGFLLPGNRLAMKSLEALDAMVFSQPFDLADKRADLIAEAMLELMGEKG
jgi:hypothetical protein